MTMYFLKIIKLLIIIPIIALLIFIPLRFVIFFFKIPDCGSNDLTGFCQGLALTFLFPLVIIVITGILGEKMLESQNHKEKPLKIILLKLITYLVIAPLAIVLTFFLGSRIM